MPICDSRATAGVFAHLHLGAVWCQRIWLRLYPQSCQLQGCARPRQRHPPPEASLCDKGPAATDDALPGLKQQRSQQQRQPCGPAQRRRPGPVTLIVSGSWRQHAAAVEGAPGAHATRRPAQRGDAASVHQQRQQQFEAICSVGSSAGGQQQGALQPACQRAWQPPAPAAAAAAPRVRGGSWCQCVSRFSV